jgi:CheY-like chemotaxis protein
MTVMVVEDNTELRESLEELLLHEGFAVDSASNGADALEKLSTIQPCVIILDLLMPVMGGVELYAHMQQDERLKHVPVIISTSDPSRAPEGSVIIRKPINLDRLLKMVRSFC